MKGCCCTVSKGMTTGMNDGRKVRQVKVGRRAGGVGSQYVGMVCQLKPWILGGAQK